MNKIHCSTWIAHKHKTKYEICATRLLCNGRTRPALKALKGGNLLGFCILAPTVYSLKKAWSKSYPYHWFEFILTPKKIIVNTYFCQIPFKYSLCINFNNSYRKQYAHQLLKKNLTYTTYRCILLDKFYILLWNFVWLLVKFAL